MEDDGQQLSGKPCGRGNQNAQATDIHSPGLLPGLDLHGLDLHRPGLIFSGFHFPPKIHSGQEAFPAHMGQRGGGIYGLVACCPSPKFHRYGSWGCEEGGNTFLPSDILTMLLKQVCPIGSYLTLWPASKEDITLALQKNRWSLRKLHITQAFIARDDELGRTQDSKPTPLPGWCAFQLESGSGCP